MVQSTCVTVRSGSVLDIDMLCFFFVFFFFQAEDGIRDLVRSRGLGDVYKRQSKDYMMKIICHLKSLLILLFFFLSLPASQFAQSPLINNMPAVSYTHLTLPTSDLV